MDIRAHKPGSGRERRLEFLDSLRGIAALYVLMYHMTLVPTPNLRPPDWLSPFVHAGGTGVTLFFVLSAFSLCLTMPGHLADAEPLRTFYVRRLFRIAPLFYTILVLTLLRDWLYFGQVHPVPGVLASVLFLFNLVPGRQEGIAWASWTISVEMLFYAVFPFIYQRVGDVPRAIALFFATLLLYAGCQILVEVTPMAAATKASFLQMTVLHHLPTFAAGICAYHFYQSYVVTGRLTRSWGVVWGLVALYAYGALLAGRLSSAVFDPFYWQTLIYAMLVVGLSAAPMGWLVNRITRFFGQISYSVYLVHANVVFFSAPIYRRLYAAIPSLTFAYGACLLWTVAVAGAIGWIFYHLIERPGIDWGRRLVRRRASRRLAEQRV